MNAQWLLTFSINKVLFKFDGQKFELKICSSGRQKYIPLTFIPRNALPTLPPYVRNTCLAANPNEHNP